MPTLGLDLAAAAATARAETFGDWFRDPWGWPEVTSAFAEGLDAVNDLGLVQHDGEFHLQWHPHFSPMEVPKTALGVRPAVVQDPLSRLAYLAAVNAGIQKLHADLPDWVFGWRQRDGVGMRSGQDEWTDYVASLPSTQQQGFGLQTDITSFFASIRPALLQPVVFSKMGKVAASFVIMDVVGGHDSLSTRSGLPQRSFASAALAHCVVQPIDDALAAADPGVSSVRRWMDDLSAEGTEEELFGLLMSLQETARQVGLELNASKTRLAPASETASELRLEDLREIPVPVQALTDDYTGETTEELDVEVLVRLEGAVLSNPRAAPRTVLRAVLNSLKKSQRFDRINDWRDVVGAIPHAADTFSRYLRAAGENAALDWADHAAWFAYFETTPWSRLGWVSSQLALSFPTASTPGQLGDILRQWLEGSTDLQKVSIAVQRLAALDPALCRTLIRARLDKTADPLMLRVFALGLLMTNENQGHVQAILERDERNRLLLALLAAQNWAPPAVTQDFETGAANTGA